LCSDLTIVDDRHKAAPKPSLTDEWGDDDMEETSKTLSPDPSATGSEKSSDKEPNVEKATPAEASAQVIETSSKSSDTVRDEEEFEHSKDDKEEQEQNNELIDEGDKHSDKDGQEFPASKTPDVGVILVISYCNANVVCLQRLHFLFD
jgi:hypothetical protein